ncbi:MAG: ergothioneine biosynthesis protein EgtB, partial [Gemmatimonadetes bacterium]|nr:ergothioneine biosynthesis protein EgtB [Gemmatimonadota bacterium]
MSRARNTFPRGGRRVQHLLSEARLTRERIAELLLEARARTLLLIAPLSDEDLHLQHDPLMSPIVWDLGHMAHFEELWLVRNLEGAVSFGEMPGIYNPFEHPRAARGKLALPTLGECQELMAGIRRQVLARLEEVDLDPDSALLRDGYVYRMVLQHEYQHNETVLQTLQLKQGQPYRALRALLPPEGRPPAAPGAMVRFPGGDVWLGTDDRSAAYDNERPRHRVRLEPFWIDVTPVTNGEYLRFVESGGYETRDHWSDAGWSWLRGVDVQAPKYWSRQNGEWLERTMDRAALLDPARPVCHVCYYEAEAYARFAGKRLPAEAEWEAAAAWDPARGEARRYPWGEQPPGAAHANLDQLAFTTA